MLTLAQKNAWLTALRSGKFKQGKNVLKRSFFDGTAEHCCLGVLCEVMGVPATLDALDGHYLFMYGGELSESILPGPFAELVGISHVGSFDPQESLAIWRDVKLNGYAGLAQANDNGVTFSEIADFLEVNLLTEG